MEKVRVQRNYRKQASSRNKKRKAPVKKRNDNTCDSQVCLPAGNDEKSGPSHQTKFTTISEEKFSGKTERIVVSESEESSNQLTGYRIIDIEVLKCVGSYSFLP